MRTKQNLALLIASMFFIWGCEVEKTEEGEMPDVDVEGGQLPAYDVDAPDVDIGTREETVTVPDIDIDMPEDEDMDNELDEEIVEPETP